MISVGLVGCASMKLDHAAPARELYVSPLFKKASAFAEATCDLWYVLSAKHGLVHPDAVLEPYDVKLGTRWSPATASSPDFGEWARQVREDLASEVAELPRVRMVLLAGGLYESVLSPCQWPIARPMSGLQIGERLQWLNAQLAQLEVSA